MKKMIVILAGVLSLIGCSSVEYHNSRRSMLTEEVPEVELNPLQADIKIGEKVSGVAECESWFGFLVKQPEKQTYGPKLQVPAGNFSPAACTRGALYDAFVKSQADLIVSPHYTAVKKGELCIFGWCIHKINQIIVTGYKATIENITPMQKGACSKGDEKESNAKKNTKFAFF